MVGWHHRLNGHEFEQGPGVGNGQRSVADYSPWGRKESNMIEEPNPAQHSAAYGSNSVSSVTQLCLALCDPMDCSPPGFPVHHQLPELAQTHVH